MDFFDLRSGKLFLNTRGDLPSPSRQHLSFTSLTALVLSAADVDAFLTIGSADLLGLSRCHRLAILFRFFDFFISASCESMLLRGTVGVAGPERGDVGGPPAAGPGVAVTDMRLPTLLLVAVDAFRPGLAPTSSDAM